MHICQSYSTWMKLRFLHGAVYLIFDLILIIFFFNAVIQIAVHCEKCIQLKSMKMNKNMASCGTSNFQLIDLLINVVVVHLKHSVYEYLISS